MDFYDLPAHQQRYITEKGKTMENATPTKQAKDLATVLEHLDTDNPIQYNGKQISVDTQGRVFVEDCPYAFWSTYDACQYIDLEC